MSATRWRQAGILAVSLLGCLLLMSACNGIRTPAASTNDSGVVEDEAAVETTSVSGTRGASFTYLGDTGNAAVVVLPGTFAPGTEITFTALELDTEDSLGPGVRIEAAGSALPTAPLFVAFEILGTVPEDAAMFAYADDSSEGEEIAATVTETPRGTLLVAPVSHLTTFWVEPRGSRMRPPAGVSRASWIDVSGSAPFRGELAASGWTSTFSLSGRLPDSGGGLYVGPVELGFVGEYDNPGVYGMASAAWKGPMEFNRLQIIFEGEILPGESDVIQAWYDSQNELVAIRASGTFVGAESEPFWAWIETEGLAGQRVPVKVEQSILPPGEVDCSLWLTTSGAFVWVSDPPQTGNVPAGPFAGTLVVR